LMMLRAVLLAAALAATADGLRHAGASSRIRMASGGSAKRYCESVYQPKRRPTRTVWAGKVPIGSDHPIALQTMTTTDTRDVMGSVEQVMKCADAGADLVRLTVQGMQEARACAEIKDTLLKKGYETALVADIHFAPKVALLVADSFDKIRVNPGNFMDGRKTFEDKSYDDETAYAREIEAIEELFTPLVEKCKDLNRAMRIGTNHGSLSARTLGKFGDTPEGMVESAFEFARICRKLDYHNFLFSMKASNPLVMCQAYRLLAAEMYEEGWDYPLHLGVTEAGEGEDGRIKSAIGIGALLQDGLGDTVRVSLTEDPEFEMVPCKTLASRGLAAVSAAPTGVAEFEETARDFQSYGRRRGELPEQREGDGDFDMRTLLHRDGSVLMRVSTEQLGAPQELYATLGCKLAVGFPFKDIATVDSIVLSDVPAADDEEARLTIRRLQGAGIGVFADAAALEAAPVAGAVAVMDLAAIAEGGMEQPELPAGALRLAVRVDGTESDEALLGLGGLDAVLAFMQPAKGLSSVHASRRVFEMLARSEADTSVILVGDFDEVTDSDALTIGVGMDLGALLVDGLGDGVMVNAAASSVDLRPLSFAVLQGSRMRNTKTEFVSCPSCGRTLFDLQTVTAEIAAKTGHLPGVAIAVMGCIVNGPGEMADADFGYVGGAPGKIDLYVGKEVVQRAIPMEEACDALVELIKEHDRWVDPPEAEEEGAAQVPAEATA